MGIIKKGLIGTAVVFGGLVYLGATAEPVSESIQAANLKKCQELHGAANIKGVNKYTESMNCEFTEAYKVQLEANKVAEAKAKEEAEAKAKAEKEAKLAAYKASPKGKTEEFMKWTATGHCKDYTKASAKFPTKVDFDWGVNRNFWMNFNDKGDARVMVQFTGEMMNGLGLMVPFKSTCKYDYNPETGKSTIIEFLL